jgi:enoyl-CoA hydratase/carnithine racemase
VVEPQEVLPTALGLAHELAQRSPRSIRLLKELLHTAVRDDPDTTMAREADALMACMDTDDWREGIAAFREKREPRFTGE